MRINRFRCFYKNVRNGIVQFIIHDCYAHALVTLINKLSGTTQDNEDDASDLKKIHNKLVELGQNGKLYPKRRDLKGRTAFDLVKNGDKVTFDLLTTDYRASPYKTLSKAMGGPTLTACRLLIPSLQRCHPNPGK